jgi:glycosyltransferase involved in cell wall biosynthesis
MKEDLIQNFKVKEELIEIIPNLCDLNTVEQAKKEEVDFAWFKEDIPIIANMGRLNKQKGQSYLLKALAKIKKGIPCRLIILGDGPLRRDLEEETERLGIKKDVAFLGFQKNPFKYLARSTVFVFPSLVEGFPNALVEAMACGLLVISFDCPSGPSEILQDNKYGILVPLKDEDKLVEAIVGLLKDKEKISYYKEQAKKRVKDFSLEKIIPLYEELFRKVTTNSDKKSKKRQQRFEFGKNWKKFLEGLNSKLIAAAEKFTQRYA